LVGARHRIRRRSFRGIRHGSVFIALFFRRWRTGCQKTRGRNCVSEAEGARNTKQGTDT
jgi:hypothetical protein